MSRVEIGGDFWNAGPVAKKNNKLYPTNTQWFISGRSALKSIIQELDNCHSVALPSWCCDSMVKPFIEKGIKVDYYPVYFNDCLIQEVDLNHEALYLIDYFGHTSPLPELDGYKGTVIRDVTHSFFSSLYTDAEYYFGSLRKWCGVWTGGFAWARDGHILDAGKQDISEYIAFRSSSMKEKQEYLMGVRKDKEYLECFKAAEDCLETAGIAPAADRDITIAEYLDVEFIKNTRRKNASVLQKAFSDWLIFPEFSSTDTPMFVPVLVPDGKRDELRRYLIHNEIYCPIHWPVSEYHKLDERSEYLYENELSLVCDQRYTEDDMCRIADVIRTFMED